MFFLPPEEWTPYASLRRWNIAVVLGTRDVVSDNWHPQLCTEQTYTRLSKTWVWWGHFVLFFFLCLILVTLFLLLGALKFLQLFLINYALCSDPADGWCGAWEATDWWVWPPSCGSTGMEELTAVEGGKVWFPFPSSLQSHRFLLCMFCCWHALLTELFTPGESFTSSACCRARWCASWRGIWKAPKAEQCKR